jgi:MerR family transcriptional regulator, copper efflux regulator
MERPFRSGELAKLTGVSTDTLRFYERSRLLPLAPRAANGYRCYPRDSLQRVLLIRRALGLGFSVAELARILKARDSGCAPCKTVRALAAEKLQKIEVQLKELKRFRKELAATLCEWDYRLAGAHPGKPAHLLEAVSLGRKKSLDPGTRSTLHTLPQRRSK